MEYQAITIDQNGREEEMTDTQRKRSMKSLVHGASSSQANEERENAHKIRPSQGSMEGDLAIATRSSQRRDEYEASEVTLDSWPQEEREREQDEACLRSQASFEYSFRSHASLEYSLALIERRLEEHTQGMRQIQGGNSAISIFRFPDSLEGISHKAQQPEILSVGPYHRGKGHLLEFEQHKWFFLQKLLHRTRTFGRDLSDYLGAVKNLEQETRECYSDIVLMPSHDFIEMMLLDGCFVIELLRYLGKSEDVVAEDDPIFSRPWLIPILIRDLLKLENQLPYFVLETLLTWSRAEEDAKNLPILALKVFDLAFPRSVDVVDRCKHWNGRHLLDLFHSSLLPLNQVNNIHKEQCEYHPSEHSIQCVTQLRPSGIKFKSRKADSFLDIKFENRVLEIPSITINDFTSTVLINCVAWEQCQEDGSKYFTDYVSFMNCLINQPRDVAHLCSDGIITRFSREDQYVANLFNNLGKNIVFNIRECYLSKQFSEVEAYYSSNWASMMRTYFSSPWSFISVFSAIVIIMLTMLQSVMSILSYKCPLV